MSAPGIFSVGGSPVSTTGTLALSLENEAANYVWAGPTSGFAEAPAFRALVATDLPAANTSSQGAVILPTGAASNTLGTAAMASTSSFDASGAAATAESDAEAYSAANNAATATALASSPTTCTAGNAPTGILTSGNATGCAPTGTAAWSSGTTYTSTTTTQYLGVSSIESGSRTNPWPAPRAGSMQSCTASANAAQSGTNYYVLYLYKNGSLCSSGPAITLNGAQYTAVADNTHTCSLAQGDLLSWQINITGTPVAAILSVTCLF